MVKLSSGKLSIYCYYLFTISILLIQCCLYKTYCWKNADVEFTVRKYLIQIQFEFNLKDYDVYNCSRYHIMKHTRLFLERIKFNSQRYELNST